MRILSVVDTTTQNNLFTGTKQDCMHFIKSRKLSRDTIEIKPLEEVHVYKPSGSEASSPLENEKQVVGKKMNFYEIIRRNLTRS